jgi:hypothetical protein
MSTPSTSHTSPDTLRSGWPLGAYAALIAAFNGLLALFFAGMQRAGRPLPARIPTQDVVLLGTATQQLSRLLTRDKITTVVRAPFTTVEGPAEEPGELEEVPAGTGLRRAVGELLTCPYCVTAWIASLLTCGLAARPRETRLVASIFAAVAVSDLLNFFYRAALGLADRLQDRNGGGGQTSPDPVTEPATAPLAAGRLPKPVGVAGAGRAA